MTLTDAGPLVALIDRNEPRHRDCLEALKGLSSPLVTTWPAFAEAMYLLGEMSGWSGQERLWRMLLNGALNIQDIDEAQLLRARNLMEKYADLPMDLADATLVALAESRRLKRVFTLDRDFRIYRLAGRDQFEIVP